MAGNNRGAQGVGKGRRMPVQQSVDIGAPIETVYNQWTQFEEWPSFMHRVTRVTQEDDCTVSFATKIWAKSKEFTASIETQRPDERIKWTVSQGMIHTGVVTFHELGPNLTRVLLSIDVEPGSLIEKAARGMRLVKRAARGDLHRFKALIEMAGLETGAWRGVIEEGELVEEHDPSYDEQREYADSSHLGEASEEADDEEDDEEQEDREDDQEKSKARRPRRARTSQNRDQEDEAGEQPETTRKRPQASSSRRTSRSRRSSGSGTGSEGGRSRSSHGSGSGQSSGRRTRTAR